MTQKTFKNNVREIIAIYTESVTML